MVTRDCCKGKTTEGTQFCLNAEKDLVKAGKDMHTNTHIPALITL